MCTCIINHEEKGGCPNIPSQRIHHLTTTIDYRPPDNFSTAHLRSDRPPGQLPFLTIPGVTNCWLGKRLSSLVIYFHREMKNGMGRSLILDIFIVKPLKSSE